MFGCRKKPSERPPWYRARGYKGDLTEKEKRELDSFRMRREHPAATFDSVPEEVQMYNFIQKQMRMSHIYQPMMIRELLKGSERASIRKIAGAFLINAMSCSHGCTRGGRHRSEIGVPAMKIVKLIAALLIGFFLSFQHSALAQSAKEASQLNNRAVELFNSGRYSEAEPIFKRALAIREKNLGPNHPDVATTLSYLALLYHDQGRYTDAEPLFKRSLGIHEKVLGPDHPDVAATLNNLAELYRAQGRYADAEPLYKRSLAIREKGLGPDHPNVATTLNNLAELYHDQGRYADAEPLYERSLAIREKRLGPDHPNVATSLNNLAALYHDQGRYADALPIVQRTIAQKKS